MRDEFTCDLCGRSEPFALTLQEAYMACCIEGHTICIDEILDVTHDTLLELACAAYPGRRGLHNKTDDELALLLAGSKNFESALPQALCPVCKLKSNKETGGNQP